MKASVNLKWDEALLSWLIQNQLDLLGQKIAVACSGGQDSMLLLQTLVDLRLKLQWKIQVLHFNHQLRGMDSDQDETFVRDFALKNDCEFEAGSARIQDIAKKEKISIESAARKKRYEFFIKAMQKKSIGYLFLAHHATDQVETILMNLIRGAGLSGLTGMDALQTYRGIQLLRPFLSFSRQQLDLLGLQNKIPFRQDLSNADEKFWRNKIRHRVLPVIREINPNLEQTFLQMSQVLRPELEEQRNLAKKLLQKLIIKQTQKELILNSGKLYTLKRLEQRLVLREAVNALRGDMRDLSFSFVENFLDRQLNGLEIKKDILIAQKTQVPIN